MGQQVGNIYPEKGAGWHEILCLQSRNDSQDAQAARQFVRDVSLREAGMYYLEFESMSVTTPTGRTWKVYGSPVSPPAFLHSPSYAPHVPQGCTTILLGCFPVRLQSWQRNICEDTGRHRGTANAHASPWYPQQDQERHGSRLQRPHQAVGNRRVTAVSAACLWAYTRVARGRPTGRERRTSGGSRAMARAGGRTTEAHCYNLSSTTLRTRGGSGRS